MPASVLPRGIVPAHTHDVGAFPSISAALATKVTIGSGASAGRVAYWENGTTVTGSATFTWVGGVLTVGGTVAPNYIALNTGAATPAHAEGTLYWDATDHTLALMSEISGSTLQVGQENWVRIVNKTGSQLNDGEVVYISGAQGNRPTAALALASSVSADRVIGVCTANIANNAEGYVTTFGIVHGYDTSGFTAGDTLYVDPTTPGALTKTAPVAPNHAVRVAYALNSTNNGTIFVAPHNGADLATLHDVLVTTPADGDVLIYQSGTSRWENKPHRYVHTQSSPATSWVIAHNLNCFPSVTVVDSGGTTGWCKVVYDSANQITITVSSAFSGKAYLN